MLNFKNAFILLIVAYMLVRLSFVGVGAISGPDENRYLRSYVGLKALVTKGDTKTFFKHIVINVAIPTNQIIQLIPCSVQLILEKTIGLPVENPVSLIIPQVFEWLVFILITLLLYATFARLFNDKTYALGITLVCIFLSNMNIYSRSLYPYDHAMLMTLVCVLFYLRADFLSYQFNAFFLGALCCLSFSTYPGYYFTPGLLVGLCLFNRRNWQSYKNLLRLAFLFASGFFMVTCFYEILGRLGGTSYIVSMLTASGKITQGDFDRGFIFIPTYFYNVEGLYGVSILILYIFGVVYALRQIINRRFGDMEILIVLSLGGILFHSSLSYFLHKMVWYGRLMHIYLPFMILGAAYFCYQLVPSVHRRNIVVTIFVVAGSVHFLFFAKSFLFDVVYPKDVLYSMRINSTKLPKDHFINQFDVTDNIDLAPANGEGPVSHISLPPARTANYYLPDTDFYLVNFGFIWPVAENKSFSDQVAALHKKLIFSGNLVIPAYLFEQMDSTQKAILAGKEVQLKIYR